MAKILNMVFEAGFRPSIIRVADQSARDHSFSELSGLVPSSLSSLPVLGKGKCLCPEAVARKGRLGWTLYREGHYTPITVEYCPSPAASDWITVSSVREEWRVVCQSTSVPAQHLAFCTATQKILVPTYTYSIASWHVR